MRREESKHNLRLEPLRMDWTPIRIRGKRRRNESPIQEGKLRAIPSRYPGVRRGHKNKVQGGLKRKLHQISKSQRKPLSPLETLPIELLQEIFILALNIALPLSSPILALHLSSEHIFLDFTTKILYPDKIEEERAQQSELFWRSTQATLLFSRKFYTWIFFKKFLSKAHSIWNKEVNNDNDSTATPTSPKYDEEPPAYLRLPDFRIPEKLLSGPWTDEKASFLDMIVWLGGSIDWVETSSGDLATTALENAVLNGHTMIASILLRPQLALPMSADLVRAALQGKAYSRQIIVQILLASQVSRGESRVDYYDAHLWAWADDNTKQGDAEGAWLKHVLKLAEHKVLTSADINWINE